MPDIKNTATSYPLTEWEIQQQTIATLHAQRAELLAALKFALSEDAGFACPAATETRLLAAIAIAEGTAA